MPQQVYSWTCSVRSFQWVINSLNAACGQVPSITVEEAGNIIGYPNCVNETYGLMSAQCMVDAFATFGLLALQAWVTYDQAYVVMSEHTGVINPIGMYHFMACRGITNGDLYVANSAMGYCGVWDELTRAQFNALGPVQVIYLPETHPA